jgi:hypothetical protein
VIFWQSSVHRPSGRQGLTASDLQVLTASVRQADEIASGTRRCDDRSSLIVSDRDRRPAHQNQPSDHGGGVSTCTAYNTPLAVPYRYNLDPTMSFSAAPPASSSHSYSFQDDDEETWKMLAASDCSGDLEGSLSGLARRLEEDHRDSGETDSDFWDSIMDRLQSKGFRYSAGEMQALPKSSGGGGDSSTKPPVAFESEMGKRHLLATSALLGGISQDRAVQVTLNALRSIDSDGSQFQSLLGSRDLLWKTLLYQQQQRLARLGVLTETLRLEQDPEAAPYELVVPFLDSLDQLYKDEDRYRGLFRRLLTIACAPTVTPSREQLEPAKELYTDPSMWTTSETNASEREWNSFCSTLVEELRMQQMRERREALEALLVLMYDRINGGVRRADYAIILMAFQSSHDFFINSPGSQDQTLRLTQLAALISAECVALWRTLDNDGTSNDSSWASQHPLLLEISASGHPQVAEHEIQALKTMLSDLVESALQRNMGGVPEALAMLSFGLLLRLGHESFQSFSQGDARAVWSSFSTTGTEMIQIANDQCNAFDYLYTILDDLTRKTLSKRSSAAHDRLYDWQFSAKKHALLLDDGINSKDAAPDSTAYTSIAREVLAASISAFCESILAIDQSNSCDNIGMLCNVGAKVFQNNPLLCEQFWSDWEVYSSGSSTAPGAFPICKLLDASHRLTVAALEAFGQGQVTQIFYVQAVAPFFQLLSTLCHTSEMVETTVTTFPEGLVRQSLLCCRLPVSSTGPPNHDYQKSRNILLTSFGRLTQFGNSTPCLKQLRRSLEEASVQGDDVVDGPRVLSRLVTGDEEARDTLEHVLTIMAHLLDGAPQQWALQLAREIMESQDSQMISLSRCLSPGQETVHSASLVLAELIEHLTAVLFSDSVNDHDAVGFLHCITSSLLSAAATLASSLSIPSSSSSSSRVSNFSFETAQTILQSLSNFLKLIRTVIQLHVSSRVRDTGVEVRDSIVNALAASTGLGQAIIYYATAPVSLTLAIKLQGAMEDRSILQQVAGGAEYNSDNAKKYGAWQAYLTPHNQSPIQHLAKHFLVESIGKLTSDDIDLDGIMARDWAGVPDVKSPLETAFSAIRLLSQWASHIEDILATHVDDLQAEPRPLNDNAKQFIETKSPYRLLSSLALSAIPCRGDSTMTSIWDSAGLSNFELLLPYLTGPTKDKPEIFEAVPSSTLLDLVHACLGHVWSISHQEVVADSVLFRALYRSSRFSKLLVESIDRAIPISKSEGHITPTERAVVLDGILSLRVLASCVGSNPTVADSVLHQEGNSIIPKLVMVALDAKELGIMDGPTLFEKEVDILRMRLSTGCLAVLASLWQSVRSLAPTKPDSSTSRLISEVDEQWQLIAGLVRILQDYDMSATLDDRMASSTNAEYARSTMVSYMALALEVLATEASHDCSNTEGSTNQGSVSLRSFLLWDSGQSYRFVRFEGYERVAALSSEFRNLTFASSVQPMRVLQCFPATSTTRLAPDFFSGGNSFDVSAATYWLAQSGDADEDVVNDLALKVATSHQLVNAEIQITEAWRRFSETATDYSAQLRQEDAKIDRFFDYAGNALYSIGEILDTMNKIQIESGNFLVLESKRMSRCLADLLLFFLDMGMQYSRSFQKLSFDKLLGILSKLASSSELALSISFPAGTNDDDIAMQQSFLAMERKLLTSTIIVLNLIDLSGTTPNSEQTSELYEAYKTLCRVNSRTLQIACNLLRRKLPNGLEKDLRESFLCCVSLFTSLFARKHGTTLDDRVYLKAVAVIMPEYNVADAILGQAKHCAMEAAKVISTEGSSSAPDAQEHIFVLQVILDFLFSIAEVGSTDLLDVLPGPMLAQVLVRNPLFTLPSGGVGDSMPRGYLLSKSNTSNSVARFKIGEDDPVHAIWVTSIKILTASMNASSMHGVGSVFFDMSLEFFQVHHTELSFSLKSCGSKLTMNSLHESTSVLGMIAEMCKRNTRDQFQQAQRDLCFEFVSWSSFAVASLSKFLCAAGTARELFHCIEQLHSESENYEIGTSPRIQLWHPLIEEGVPSAKHEAVKFSHYASRCYQRVTTSDFQSSSTTSRRFETLAKATDGDTDLERTSRLAVTNDFAIRMEQCAAACLAEAASVLWRMHPASFSFRAISDMETLHMDVMSLVQMGTIIGFHPFEGGGVLASVGPRREGFETLNFGRVVSIDTIKRAWVVAPLDRGNTETSTGDHEPTWVVRAGQLAGFEDPTSRKAVTSFLPAPNTLSELENANNKLGLGHLILVLRWCHQESLFRDSQALDRSTYVSSSVRRLAEQVTALLGADLSIHDEVGTRSNVMSKYAVKLDSQIFELFADRQFLESSDLEDTAATSIQDGRLQRVIDKSAWAAIRPQVLDEVRRCWKEKQEKVRRRNEKRSLSNDVLWYSGLHRKGGISQKSAFRGFS